MGSSKSVPVPAPEATSTKPKEKSADVVWYPKKKASLNQTSSESKSSGPKVLITVNDGVLDSSVDSIVLDDWKDSPRRTNLPRTTESPRHKSKTESPRRGSDSIITTSVPERNIQKIAIELIPESSMTVNSNSSSKSERNNQKIDTELIPESSMTVNSNSLSKSATSSSKKMIKNRSGSSSVSTSVTSELHSRGMPFSRGTTATFSSSETLELMIQGELSVELDNTSTQRPWLLPVSAQAFDVNDPDHSFWERYRNEFAPSPLMTQRREVCRRCNDN